MKVHDDDDVITDAIIMIGVVNPSRVRALIRLRVQFTVMLSRYNDVTKGPSDGAAAELKEIVRAILCWKVRRQRRGDGQLTHQV